MSNDIKGLIRLNKSNVKPAVDVLVRAFWNHPPIKYYFPDEAERGRIAPYFFTLSVSNGIRHGEVHATSQDFEGITVWLPSDNYPVTLWRLLRCAPFRCLRFSALEDMEVAE